MQLVGTTVHLGRHWYTWGHSSLLAMALEVGESYWKDSVAVTLTVTVTLTVDSIQSCGTRFSL